MKRILVIAGSVILPFTAWADSPKGNYVFHLARRVADTEKERGLPSRAVWLSNRAVKTSKEIARKAGSEQPQESSSQKN